MLSTSSRSAVFGSGVKRKTLVVSGIERNNFAALEGLRVWCEVSRLIFLFFYFVEVTVDIV
jgi:hypothetical protein